MFSVSDTADSCQDQKYEPLQQVQHVTGLTACCGMSYIKGCASLHNNAPSRYSLIKLPAAYNRVNGESETRELSCHMLSADHDGRVREHGVPLQCVICSCMLDPDPLGLMEGSCGISMQGNASVGQLWGCNMPCCDIAGLLTTWLLKRLICIWNCCH